MNPHSASTRSCLIVVLTVWVASPALSAPCQEKTWTTTADFAGGFGVNVDKDDASGQVSAIVTSELLDPLPYLWVACSGRGTIVRVFVGDETQTPPLPPRILGEYLSAPGEYPLAFPGRARNPSRIAVSLTGDAWATNRDADSDGTRKGGAVKIGLVIGGERGTVDAQGVFTPDSDGEYLRPPFTYCSCADRNGDGYIRTSSGLDNILPWPDNTDGQGAACGPALVEDAVDECILVYQRTNAGDNRHVSIDARTDVWIGTDGRGPNDLHRAFDLLAGETGEILESFEAMDEAGVSSGGYGGLVDGNGVLWSSTPGSEHTVLRYDTGNSMTVLDDVLDVIDANESYAVALDRDGYLWVSQHVDANLAYITKLNYDGSLFEGFPKHVWGDWDRG